ncbi:hypothetical protein AX774_g2896 [Zancudomyces culisetae]|uniref:Uncharacterized protein n=1 Tax=Zancudomyces culisetae TaxID=1213189 RepID=A0A1R1PRS5_ZANCU|nr:hypothetical protein AX774_g2896 [Zancudomyces culisetae]|eukprot:OMH83593.1 hypothetical protein AX774_g2896 [Zancudomyces culisetae]
MAVRRDMLETLSFKQASVRSDMCIFKSSSNTARTTKDLVSRKKKKTKDNKSHVGSQLKGAKKDEIQEDLMAMGLIPYYHKPAYAEHTKKSKPNMSYTSYGYLQNTQPITNQTHHTYYPSSINSYPGYATSPSSMAKPLLAVDNSSFYYPAPSANNTVFHSPNYYDDLGNSTVYNGTSKLLATNSNSTNSTVGSVTTNIETSYSNDPSKYAARLPKIKLSRSNLLRIGKNP